MSIKDLPIRCKKHGKTRGRPSREESTASKVLSWMVDRDPYRSRINDMILESILYGVPKSNKY